MKKLKNIAGVALTVAAISTFNLNAEVSPRAIEKSLSGVRAPELPAKAASLVAKAKGTDQEPTTVAVVKSAIGVNPASAAPVVGAIAHAAPKMASVAAATAVSLQPKQAAAIARAAASAAPTEAEKIAAAMTKESPTYGALISQTVSSAVNDKAKGSPAGFQGAPTVGPPFVPRPGTGGEVNRTNTTVVPPGGRGYFSP